MACNSQNCVNGCGGTTCTCGATCRGTCESDCDDTCGYDGCSDSCSSCTGSCTGSCSGGCSGSCTGTCKTTCTGGCTGACNFGCTSSTQSDNHTTVQQILARDIMYAADANLLRNYIFSELSRRGKSGTAAEVSQYTIISGSWWNTLRTNLEQVIAIDDTSAAGNITTKAARDEIINKAIQLYNTVIAKS